MASIFSAHAIESLNCSRPYDSFGEWMRSCGCPQPTSSGAAPLHCRSADTTGIDAPSYWNTGPRGSISSSAAAASLNTGEASGRRNPAASPVKSSTKRRIPRGVCCRR